MNTLLREQGIRWNLKKTDKRVGDIVEYIVKELNISPLRFCAVVEHNLTTHNENGYFVFCDKEIYVPETVVQGRDVSLPVMLFTILFGYSSHACFVWSKLDYYKEMIVKNKQFHDALCVVGDWFYGMYMNCPVMDEAICVGRSDLKVMVSELAYRMRLASGFSTSENMRRLTYFLESPWVVEPDFLKTFIDISVRSSIHFKGIGIEKNVKGEDRYYVLKSGLRHFVELKGHILVKDKVLPETTDIILEKIQRMLVQIKFGEEKEESSGTEFGLVCCPRDKLVFLAVLLFSTDYNLYNTLLDEDITCPLSSKKVKKKNKENGILSEFPEPLQVIIQFIVRPHEATFQLPGHFDHIK